MKKKVRANQIKASYGQIPADPEEIEQRLARAFAVVFEEMVAKRKEIGAQDAALKE